MNNNDIPKNGWNEWAKYVLKTLEELKQQHVDSENKLDKNKEDSDKKIIDVKDKTVEEIGKLVIAIKILETRMTTRAAFSGAFAAMVPVTIALVIWLVTKT
jgi:hypothetical protein